MRAAAALVGLAVTRVQRLLEALSSPPPPRRSPPRASSTRARVVVVRRREIVRWRPRAAPRRRGVERAATSLASRLRARLRLDRGDRAPSWGKSARAVDSKASMVSDILRMASRWAATVRSAATRRSRRRRASARATRASRRARTSGSASASAPGMRSKSRPAPGSIAGLKRRGRLREAGGGGAMAPSDEPPRATVASRSPGTARLENLGAWGGPVTRAERDVDADGRTRRRESRDGCEGDLEARGDRARASVRATTVRSRVPFRAFLVLEKSSHFRLFGGRSDICAEDADVSCRVSASGGTIHSFRNTGAPVFGFRPFP